MPVLLVGECALMVFFFATGEANLSIPLSGPKGKATLYVEAKKSADVWLFQTMVVKIEKTGERIDLNKPAH